MCHKVHVYKYLFIRINGFMGLTIYSGRQPLLQTDHSDVLTLLSDVKLTYSTYLFQMFRLYGSVLFHMFSRHECTFLSDQIFS